MMFYGTGFILGTDTGGSLTELAILPLILIPLSLGYSVVRYRLMDVELVVRRTAVYAATTLAIALGIGVIVYFIGFYAFGGSSSASGEFISLPLIISVILMAVIVMVAAP